MPARHLGTLFVHFGYVPINHPFIKLRTGSEKLLQNSSMVTRLAIVILAATVILWTLIAIYG